jgi:hypothetical protein
MPAALRAAWGAIQAKALAWSTHKRTCCPLSAKSELRRQQTPQIAMVIDRRGKKCPECMRDIVTRFQTQYRPCPAFTLNLYWPKWPHFRVCLGVSVFRCRRSSFVCGQGT